MSKIKVDLTNKRRQLTRTRLARECSKLDPKEEKALAEEGLGRGAEAARLIPYQTSP